MIKKEQLISTRSTDVKQQTAKNIWGKIVLYLREKNETILHIVCGDIVDVEFKDDLFVINTSKKSVESMLKNNENFIALKKAFNFFGIDKFDICLNENAKTDEENIEKLNKYFAGIVKVKKGE